MTTSTSSQSASQVNPQVTPPAPLSRSGIMAALAAFLHFSDAVNKLIVQCDDLLTNFSKKLTYLGQKMNDDLTAASAKIKDLSGSSDSVAIAAANDNYQNIQTADQNAMTPYNTQVSNWTDEVKQATTDQSNTIQYCQSVTQMITNLANRS